NHHDCQRLVRLFRGHSNPVTPNAEPRYVSDCEIHLLMSATSDSLSAIKWRRGQGRGGTFIAYVNYPEPPTSGTSHHSNPFKSSTNALTSASVVSHEHISRHPPSPMNV